MTWTYLKHFLWWLLLNYGLALQSQEWTGQIFFKKNFGIPDSEIREFHKGWNFLSYPRYRIEILVLPTHGYNKKKENVTCGLCIDCIARHDSGC